MSSVAEEQWQEQQEERMESVDNDSERSGVSLKTVDLEYL